MTLAGPPAAWDRSDVALCAGLVATSVVAQVPLALRTVGGCDEWHILDVAAQILDGALLYRDTTHIAGPGAFYLAAGLFGVFGVRFAVARAAMVVVFALLTVLVYVMTRRIAGRGAATAASVWTIAFRLWSFPHWQMFHYASLAHVTIVSAFVLLRPHLPASRLRAALAGAFAAGAALTKQDAGALGAIGCVLALGARARLRRRAGLRDPLALPQTVAFVATAAVVVLAVVGYFAVRGALGEMFLQTVWDTMVQHPLFVRGNGAEAVDYLPFPDLFPLFHQDAVLRSRLLSYVPALLWDIHWRALADSRLFRETPVLEMLIKVGFRVPYAVLLVEGVLLARAWRRVSVAAPAALDAIAARTAQVLFAGCVLAGLSKPRDWIHLSVLVAPVVPLAARQLAALFAALPRGGRIALRAAVLAAGVVYIGVSAEVWVRALATYTAPISGPRGVAYARAPDAATLQGLIDTLGATPADRPMLAVPCVSAATFLVGRPAASRFPWLWPRDAHPDRDQQVIASLDRRPNTTVIYTLSHMPFLPRLQQHAPELFRTLAERYRMGPVFGPDAVHLIATVGTPRSPEPPGTTVPLAERLPHARATWEHDGVVVPVPPLDAAGRAVWPLTPDVLFVVPPENGEMRIAFPVDVPAGARLRLAAGVNPDRWQALSPFPLRLRVEVEDGTGVSSLLDIRRDVFTSAADRAWVPLDAPLDAFAGRRVSIVLSAAADGPSTSGREIAGFENPRIVSLPP